ncbi:MAG: hypothetical protein HYZ37_00510 [Candidatus Solibacter usitatus]|nr:hypothetical protein [Candidatus Solibacter usitatus]
MTTVQRPDDTVAADKSGVFIADTDCVCIWWLGPNKTLHLIAEFGRILKLIRER